MQFRPYPYQQYCVEQIIKKPAVALWLDMGLGKTAITLTAIQKLMYDRFEVSRVLVIAPKKVAEATWQDEAAKWDNLSGLTFSLIAGSRSARIAALPENSQADIYILGRDNVQWLADLYKSRWPFDMVVLDEATSFKNHQSKRFRALKSERMNISRIVELTGTPAPNGLLDLWAQMKLLDGGQRLGARFTSYRTAFFEPDKRSATQIFSYKPLPGAEEKIKDRVSDICISMKSEDYIELPELIEHDVPVALAPRARKAYDDLEKDMFLQIGDGIDDIDAVSAGVLCNKLLQMCNGAAYTSRGNTAFVHNSKIDAFKELLESLGENHALVFYMYRFDIERLKDAAEKAGRTVRVYEGADDARAWNAGEVDVLLAHPVSCGYGLNLQYGGHDIVWFGLTWNLELYQQANKRLHRNGQKQPVIVHRLIVKDSMDETVAKALAGKDETQDRLLTALKARLKEKNNDRL